MRWQAAFVAVVLAFVAVATSAARPEPHEQTEERKTQAVVLIVSDGLRWQEVFTGADPQLLNTKNGGSWRNEKDLKSAYWRENVEERRAALLPFLWNVIAKQGQLYGNQTRGSVARVTNGLNFSYPGYNEMLTGKPDPRIDSNDFGPNPNATVFEWLNAKPDFTGRVAVFATWGAFRDIFNQPRSHVEVHVGWDTPYSSTSGTPRDSLMADLYAYTTRLDEDDTYDPYLQAGLLDYVKTKKPRVLFVGYGETDNWAHQGRYDLVLESAHDMDHFVGELWEAMQAMPEYRGRVTFLITADHGRGSAPVEWKEHGKRIKGSENIWLAVIGPDTAPLGERTNIAAITQSQIAATVAALLGEDYRSAVTTAAGPIRDAVAAPPKR